MTIENPVFFGEGYIPELDHERLTSQLNRVFDYMSDQDWHTLADVSENAHGPEASISAAIRALRNEKNGGYIVDRRRVGNHYEYKLNLKEAEVTTNGLV